mmetsp:Transcript_15093/g.25951  ORF Transcript_15093/g.25951 Transcript_15093/m.25951 type:complete len:316 (+) Transcript_15093:29-976(+)
MKKFSVNVLRCLSRDSFQLHRSATRIVVSSASFQRQAPSVERRTFSSSSDEPIGDNENTTTSTTSTAINEEDLKVLADSKFFNLASQIVGRPDVKETVSESAGQSLQDRKNEEEQDFSHIPPHLNTRRRWAVQDVLKIGRHTKITAGGRINSFSSLVILGDGAGTAGFGYGKALTATAATQKAVVDAEKAAFTIPLTEDFRLLRGFKVKQDGALIEVMVKQPGNDSNTCNYVMQIVCKAFGVRGLVVKTIGRRNPLNVIRAFFKGMHDFPISERAYAQARGQKWFDVRRDYRYRSTRASKTGNLIWAPAKSRNNN